MARTPFMGPSFLEGGVHLSAVTPFFSTLTTRSTMETLGGHAERDAVELALELGEDERHRLGRARGGGHDVERRSARAAEVAVGRIEDALVARYEWQVVIVPLTMPNLSSSTFAKGARQLVVHEALETMFAEASYSSALTPTTYVGMSLPLAGAVMTTFFAPAWMCLPAPGPSRKTPVPSMTMSMPIASQGEVEGIAVGDDGDVLAVDRDGFVVDDLDVGVERAEDGVILEEVRRGLAPPDWFTQTTSRVSSPRDIQQRTKLRPEQRRAKGSCTSAGSEGIGSTKFIERGCAPVRRCRNQQQRCSANRYYFSVWCRGRIAWRERRER